MKNCPYGGAARADAVDDAEQCASKHDDSKIKIDDSAIEYCTKAIDSGDLSAEDMASTYFERGAKYQSKGDFDRAIADYRIYLDLYRRRQPYRE